MQFISKFKILSRRVEAQNGFGNFTVYYKIFVYIIFLILKP